MYLGLNVAMARILLQSSRTACRYGSIIASGRPDKAPLSPRREQIVSYWIGALAESCAEEWFELDRRYRCVPQARHKMPHRSSMKVKTPSVSKLPRSNCCVLRPTLGRRHRGAARALRLIWRTTC